MSTHPFARYIPAIELRMTFDGMHSTCPLGYSHYVRARNTLTSRGISTHALDRSSILSLIQQRLILVSQPSTSRKGRTKLSSCLRVVMVKCCLLTIVVGEQPAKYYSHELITCIHRHGTAGTAKDQSRSFCDTFNGGVDASLRASGRRRQRYHEFALPS